MTRKSDWKIFGPGGAAELLGIKPATLVARKKDEDLKRRQLKGVGIGYMERREEL